MGHSEIGPVAQQIGTLFEGGSLAGLSDRQLLERFNVRRDAGGEAAFAALVARHGPMVHGVCRQLLDDWHLADDAFQPTFLVLAKKARSIRDPGRLGNWLYGVAFRTARCAGLRLARRRKREVGTMNRSGSSVLVDSAAPAAIEEIITVEQAVALNADARQPTAQIRLRPEQVIRGRLVDVQGQPAAGVELHVWSVGRPNVPEAKGGYDGVNMGNPPPPEGLRVWPRPRTTDDQGRFAVAGIGRDVTVGFHVVDRRFASAGFRVQTDDPKGPKLVTQALLPAVIVEGRVLTADTGQPIPHSLVEVGARITGPGGRVLESGGVRSRADQEGRFTVSTQPAKNYRVRAFPPEGQPYLSDQIEFEWIKGAVRKEIDVKVPRGVVVHGKVIERGTERALPEASVQYIKMGYRGTFASPLYTIVASGRDGTYQITVPPGKGHLLVFGPTSDYVLEAIGSSGLYSGQPGGVRHYAHAIIPYEVGAGDQPHEIAAAL
jgi:DNA-directed RNA polymerase specialized sigma24 family protein